MKKLILATLISSLALSGCGGSSSSGSSQSKDEVPSIYGKWNTPVFCQYDDEGPMYFTERLVITADTITVKQTNYAEDDSQCSGVGTEDNKEYDYTLGDLITPINSSDIKVQQLDITGEDKMVFYVSPGSKHLVVTGSDDDDYPQIFRVDQHYIKDGADLAPSGVTVTVLGHSGIELSSGTVNEYEENHDIATILWSPTDVGPSGGTGWGEGVWIRPYYTTQVDAEDPADPNVYIMDMGEVALSSVTEAPTSWPQRGETPLQPITEGHVYVVRLMNGKYAKLRALHELDVEADWWSILIEYQLMD